MSFKEILDSNKFSITAELSPPKGVDVDDVLKKADFLKGKVHAVNVTDNQRAILHMSSVAFCTLLKQKGLDPVLQITCRDRNALAIQSDILGAYALGIRNVLALSGDYPRKVQYKAVKPVFDIDSVQLIKLIRDMEKGKDLAGEELKGAPKFSVGAVVNPTATPIDMQIIKLKKKVDAGAEFIQTQIIYDIDGFKYFRDRVNHIKAKYILGILPFRSYKMAHFMANEVQGVNVPDKVLKRIEKAKDPIKEGIDISVETIKALKGYIDGIHLMTLNHVDVIPEIISRT
ncbi:methylenetetrahydrofolate reductase [Candidatus Margulisiibacteriota bacterium]